MSGASPKRHKVEWVKGPVGVQSRNFSNERIYSTGWQARFPLVEGILRTVPWIEAQVKAARQKQGDARCPGLADKFACVAAHRFGASNGVTLGCVRRRGGSAESGVSAPARVCVKTTT